MVLAWLERLEFLVEKTWIGAFERRRRGEDDGEEGGKKRDVRVGGWRETGFNFLYFVGGLSNCMVVVLVILGLF